MGHFQTHSIIFLTKKNKNCLYFNYYTILTIYWYLEIDVCISPYGSPIDEKRTWTFQSTPNCYWVGLGNILILYQYCDMRLDIVLDCGYRNIAICHQSCLFLVLKLHYKNKIYKIYKIYDSLNLPDCSSCFVLYLLPTLSLYPYYWWLFIKNFIV